MVVAGVSAVRRRLGAGGSRGHGGQGHSGQGHSGVADPGLADSGLPDSGRADSGLPDSGGADFGRADSGRAEGGPGDGGRPDRRRADGGPGGWWGPGGSCDTGRPRRFDGAARARWRTRLDDLGVPSGPWWQGVKWAMAVAVAGVLFGINIGRIATGDAGQVGAGCAGLVAWRCWPGGPGSPWPCWSAKWPWPRWGPFCTPTRRPTGPSFRCRSPCTPSPCADLAARRCRAMVVTWLCIGGWGVVFGRPAATLFSALFIFLSITSVALYVRSYRALVASLRERADQAERERRWSTNQAVGRGTGAHRPGAPRRGGPSRQPAGGAGWGGAGQPATG